MPVAAARGVMRTIDGSEAIDGDPEPGRLIDVLSAHRAHVDEPDSIVEAILTWARSRGTALYPHQEEAILEWYTGANVILSTPTGSGKSMVALAAHAASVCGGGRSWYTAPVKALVSEKFFDLVDHFGADNVGLLTGDSSINADAPIICCTTEILALAALGSGRELAAATVILDEFHYYGDPDRGWAWQTPLIALPQSQFLLMSATLGDTGFFRGDLTRRTGRDTVLINRAIRPVPLTYEYRTSPLHFAVEDLLAHDQAPLYIVNFSQRDALDVATAMASITKLEGVAKQIVADELAAMTIPPGFGRDLARLMRNGVGVHHAGMLPRYRRLVERLTQLGALRIVSGTDTLGVGVNLPIRTVVLTRLYKYDGRGTAILAAREFHQIAGRAGRAGFDTTGLVVCLAPDHVAENDANAAKAAADSKKKKKLHKVAAPKGFVHYDADTFARLQDAPPEPLVSSFRMTPGMLMQLLTKPGNTYRNVRRILTDNHEPRVRQRRLIRDTIRLYKGLRVAGVVEELDEPDELGRWVAVDRALQDDFALDQLLAPFLLYAVPLIPRPTGSYTASSASPIGPSDHDADDESNEAANDESDGRYDADDERLAAGYAFAVLALVEAVVENPFPVLVAQRDKAKDEAMAEMKAAGVEYEERMTRLEKINYPQPLRDDIYELFDRWRQHNPWIGDNNIAPKGVVRDMWDRAMDFPAFVRHYGLKRSEGVLLRYLSAVYKTLTRSVPVDDLDEQLSEMIAWLGGVIRSTDSSLVDEWEAARTGVVADQTPTETISREPDRFAQLLALARNKIFRWVQFAATGSLGEWADELAECGDIGWNERKLADLIAPIDGAIDFGSNARAADLFDVDVDIDGWSRLRQRLIIDDEISEWLIEYTAELADDELHIVLNSLTESL